MNDKDIVFQQECDKMHSFFLHSTVKFGTEAPAHQYINYGTNQGEVDNIDESIANNKEVHVASRAAMNDKNIRNAGFNAMMSGGNDPNANKKLVGALAQNKQVQGAAISVAKDKKVQKAAWNGVKKNATRQNAKKVKKFALSFNM